MIDDVRKIYYIFWVPRIFQRGQMQCILNDVFKITWNNWNFRCCVFFQNEHKSIYDMSMKCLAWIIVARERIANAFTISSHGKSSSDGHDKLRMIHRCPDLASKHSWYLPRPRSNILQMILSYNYINDKSIVSHIRSRLLLPITTQIACN